ncbi:MAG: hypothetical protein HZC48_07295 [Nitrospirae bacterium]|nr:hypothetical protein [Nitrospirota bacterium]
MTDLMPVIFFGHGNPMNALSKNAYTNGIISDTSRVSSNTKERLWLITSAI